MEQSATARQKMRVVQLLHAESVSNGCASGLILISDQQLVQNVELSGLTKSEPAKRLGGHLRIVVTLTLWRLSPARIGWRYHLGFAQAPRSQQ